MAKFPVRIHFPEAWALEAQEWAQVPLEPQEQALALEEPLLQVSVQWLVPEGLQQLVDLQLVDSQPVDSQPVDSQPVDSQPVDSQPVDSQPVDS
ncbi:MAG: hypothetical protein ACI9R3_003519, partial [Verrucomicrobiales bacterium]